MGKKGTILSIATGFFIAVLFVALHHTHRDMKIDQSYSRSPNSEKRSKSDSVVNPTVLLVDLQLFKLLSQLIYHGRSCNCFLCTPHAHKDWLIVLVEQWCTEIKAIKWVSRQHKGFRFLDYWNQLCFTIWGRQHWSQNTVRRLIRTVKVCDFELLLLLLTNLWPAETWYLKLYRCSKTLIADSNHK